MRTKVLYVLLALLLVLSGAIGGRAMADRPDGSPTAVDVVLRPEWAAVQGTDKNLIAIGINKGEGEYIEYNLYTVPVGKQFVMTAIGVASYANVVANADLNQIFLVRVVNVAETLNFGGNGGAYNYLPRPIVFAAGVIPDIFLYNFSNHHCDLRLSVQGYEVDV